MFINPHIIPPPPNANPVFKYITKNKPNIQDCQKDSKGRYNVHYTATVRITHVASGSYREDVGANDSIDKSLGSAVANAMKGAVTDAMKRAARHFGEKLGNCTFYTLYRYIHIYWLLYCIELYCEIVG